MNLEDIYSSIKQGLESMHRGEGRPAEDVFRDMRKKHDISLDA